MKKSKNLEPILIGIFASLIIGFLAFLSFETSTGFWLMFSFGSTTLIVLIFYDSEVFNVRHCLPNKLFEYIQARIAVAIGPSPDMLCLVEKYKCGFVSEKFTLEAMINTLNQLTPNMINLMKDGSHKAADYLCWEKECERVDLSNL